VKGKENVDKEGRNTRQKFLDYICYAETFSNSFVVKTYGPVIIAHINFYLL
jgi:hypothetical protein